MKSIFKSSFCLIVFIWTVLTAHSLVVCVQNSLVLDTLPKLLLMNKNNIIKELNTATVTVAIVCVIIQKLHNKF